MHTDHVLQINDSLWIPRAELDYRASRSGGPGGQHANTTSSRIELLWNVDESPSLSEAQKDRVRKKLGNRISTEGVLQLAGSEHRSQHKNRDAVTERFVELVREALVVPKKRKKTRPPRRAKEARLRAKKRRSEIKRMRGPVRRDE